MNAYTPHSPVCPSAAGDAAPDPFPPTVSIHAGGGAYSPVVSATTPLEDAQHAFNVVYAAYNKALTLRQSKKAHQIHPALLEARKRLTQAQLDADGIGQTKRRVLGWSA